MCRVPVRVCGGDARGVPGGGLVGPCPCHHLVSPQFQSVLFFFFFEGSQSVLFWSKIGVGVAMDGWMDGLAIKRIFVAYACGCA